MKTRLGAVVLAGSLLVAACSSPMGRSAGDVDPADLQRHRAPATSHGTASSHRHEPEVIEAAPEPDGFRMVAASRSALRLAVPADWVRVDSDDVADAAPDRMADLADRMGVTPEQLRQAMDQVEVYAVGPTGDTLNLTPSTGLGAVPNEATIRAQIEALGAEVSRVRSVEVPAGGGRLAYFSMSLPGQPRQWGAGLLLQAPGGIVNLTVSTTTRSVTRRVMDEILPTITPLGGADPA